MLKFSIQEYNTQGINMDTEVSIENPHIGTFTKEFLIQTNPLLTYIRDYGKEIFREVIEPYVQIGVNDFDLAVQTMIHISRYGVDEVWLGDPKLLKSVKKEIRHLNTNEARKILDDALIANKISLNEKLVHSEARTQCARLAKMFSDLQGARTEEIDPAFLNNENSSPFLTEFPDPRLKVIGFRYDKDSEVDYFEAFEVNSGKKVIFKPISSEMSKVYGKDFHYLHYPRNDEIAAFGAYVEDMEYPFAWVSYSKVGRIYKREMLSYQMIDPRKIVELTRAWSSIWSPKNTMSLLFHYAHKQLRTNFSFLKRGEIEGVITAVNVNLGFKGSGFKAVGFKTIGLKPAKFTFFQNESGETTYMTRRAMQRLLELNSVAKLVKHPRFITNKFPLLPTHEMLLRFDTPSLPLADSNNELYKIFDQEYNKG